MKFIGIIGSAGRNEEASLVNLQVFERMVYHAEKEISPDDVLVSGGAAWADHVAVKLFLDDKVQGLVLCLPCKFLIEKNIYSEISSDGRTSNFYHRKFSKATGFDSLGEIALAIEKGARVHIGGSFFERNQMIAEKAKDFLLCFSNGVEQGKGGSFYTWKRSKSLKKNISLNELWRDLEASVQEDQPFEEE